MSVFRKVKTRCCPTCGFLMSQKEIDMLMAVVECPNKCGTNINDFQIVDREEVMPFCDYFNEPCESN